MGLFDPSWWATRARYGAPGVRSPRAERRFVRLVSPLVRLAFRPRIEGLEHLPREGGYLLVSNHSGGMAVAEVLCLATLLFSRAPGVRLAAMAHPLSFALWPLTTLMRWAGAIPSTYEAALETLRSGTAVLVFPGGDYEAARPAWRWREVDFGGRQGFLRIAKQAGVPIVPMGIANSHLTVPILWRSDLVLPYLLVLPRLLGLKRYPLTLLGAVGATALCVWGPAALGWPFTVALVVGWLGSPFALLPIVPMSVRIRVGPPLLPEALFEGAERGTDAAYAQVVGRIQALVRGE